MNTVVQTVAGPIQAERLGPTLMHEHLYCDISGYSKKADNRVTDVAAMVAELRLFRAAGGGAIVELTSEGIGRDPLKLREIGAAAGVPIVSGIAFYDESTYPAWVRTATVDGIADYFARQIMEGADGVRAGLIGELMSHNEAEANPAGYRLRDGESRVFQAAAQAQRRTGVAISTHAALGRAGHAQLDVLERSGADLSRVVIGHCDAHWHEDSARDLGYYLPILERGAFCQFDMIGWSMFAPDEVRADRIAALVRMGYANRITISTDTCRQSQLRQNGGRGLTYLWDRFLPLLQARGVTGAEIHAMLVEAPRRMLSGG